MADPDLLRRARELLAEVTPLPYDCGTLCGHKCCTDYAPNVGVYLLPGELELFDGTEDWLTWQHHSPKRYEFAPSWSRHRTIPFMRCHSLCLREKRPFECRTYPLVPFLQEDGRVEMRYSPWAEGVCPLVERFPMESLQPAFRERAREAWQLLIQDAEMLDHVRWLTEQLRAWAELPHTENDQ